VESTLFFPFSFLFVLSEPCSVSDAKINPYCEVDFNLGLKVDNEQDGLALWASKMVSLCCDIEKSYYSDILFSHLTE
jgi:hypothetical protein